MIRFLRRWGLAAHIALRIVRSRRSKRLSTVTMISIVGVAFGVLALTAVLGVTGGFQTAFQERILGLYPHLVVLKRTSEFRDYEPLLDALVAEPGIAGATPATYDDMMMASSMQRSGAIIKGLHLPTVRSVLPVASLLTEGTLDSLEEAPNIAVSEGVLRADGLVAGTWTTIIVGPDGAATALEEERTPPDTGRVRLRVLDLRTGATPTPLTLVPDGDPKAASKGASDAIDRAALLKNLEGLDDLVVLDTLGELDGSLKNRSNDLRSLLDAQKPQGRLSTNLGTTIPGALGPAVEMHAGTWRLDINGAPSDPNDLIELTPDTVVTLALVDGEAEGRYESELWVEPPPTAMSDHQAMVRVVRVDEGTDPIALTATGPSGEGEAMAEVATLAGGERTGFQPVYGRLPGIILGKDLAARLDATMGSQVTLVTPLRGVDNKMLGAYGMAPTSVRHQVTGIFSSGFYEYDIRLGLVNLKAAQRFLNRGDIIRWIEVRSEDVLDMAGTKRRVASVLDPYTIESLVAFTSKLRGQIQRIAADDIRGLTLRKPSGFIGQFDNATQVLSAIKYQDVDFGYRPQHRLIDWQEMNANLLGALRLQKVVLTIFFLIIIVVASFVVVGSQIMIVHEKTADIAILKAMGCTRGTVRLAFTFQGLMIAGLGAGVGLLAGGVLVAVAGAVEFPLDAAVYLIDRLPVHVDMVDLLLIGGATGLCTAVATQYSAGMAARKTVIEGLRSVG